MEATAKNYRKRNAILHCLQCSTAHPTAEMVFAEVQKTHPDISLATVYRNLSRFRSQGMAQVVATVNGSERFDANTHPHVHFICTGCQAVIDLPQLQVPEALCGAAAAGVGGSVDTCQLSFTGLCGECSMN